MVDPSKFTSDMTRLAQVGCLAGLALFSFLNAVIRAEFLVFLLMLITAAFVFVTIAPIYLQTLSSDTSPLPRTGHIALRAAEAAGLAGLATVIAVLFGGLSILAKESSIPTFIVMILVFGVQATVCLAIAVGVGMTNLLRNQDVVLESPPPPQPKAAPPQQYQQPPQQYQQPPQQYQQPPQQYQQPPAAEAQPPAYQPPVPSGTDPQDQGGS